MVKTRNSLSRQCMLKLQSAISSGSIEGRAVYSLRAACGVFGYGGSNDVTAIFVTWLERHAFVGGLP